MVNWKCHLNWLCCLLTELPVSTLFTKDYLYKHRNNIHLGIIVTYFTMICMMRKCTVMKIELMHCKSAVIVILLIFSTKHNLRKHFCLSVCRCWSFWCFASTPSWRKTHALSRGSICWMFPEEDSRATSCNVATPEIRKELSKLGKSVKEFKCLIIKEVKKGQSL